MGEGNARNLRARVVVEGERNLTAVGGAENAVHDGGRQVETVQPAAGPSRCGGFTCAYSSAAEHLGIDPLVEILASLVGISVLHRSHVIAGFRADAEEVEGHCSQDSGHGVEGGPFGGKRSHKGAFMQIGARDVGYASRAALGNCLVGIPGDHHAVNAGLTQNTGAELSRQQIFS